MAIPIPSPLVEFILLGPLDDRRQLQDSPILGDVWVEYGKNPDKALDLLIEPYRGQHAGAVAAAIDDGLGLGLGDTKADISYLQGIIAARLSFRQLLEVVVPKTDWWFKKKKEHSAQPTASAKRGKPKGVLAAYTPARRKSLLEQTVEMAKAWQQKAESLREIQDISTLDRFVALGGLILWACNAEQPEGRLKSDDQIEYILDKFDVDDANKSLGDAAHNMEATSSPEPLVWQVSVNRRPLVALTRSVPAVKADAAKTLFTVNCADIVWAVVDSGIDGDHPAFRTADGENLRVQRSFDFRNFRYIVNLSNSKTDFRERFFPTLVNKDLLDPPEDAHADLRQLAADARNRGPVRWDLVERFVEIQPDTPPPASHGTHVAGIIGANKQAALKNPSAAHDDCADGMCPDILLYDFRVLGRDAKDTEFAIIAALQFIRHLNERDNLKTIHGVNLSLSIPHDVRNFACGRTPICEECERLVESGVVVVTAAGNHGYKSFETKDGSYDTYAAFSITDPGNADSVLTVGSTHRFWPHTYGVSFFSSRGPTGDGRLKPDLVAPGERIRAPLPKGEWGDLDGTSMAAPHVSGAAAMLMARYSELIGHPRRVKQILCDSATDLGRERSFQGRGMLDVLRAFQSI